MDKAAIEALKASRPILEVLRDLGVEVRAGRIRCPRPENHSHGDRTPSVSVRPDRGSFKCWVCADVGGDVIDLVRLVKGCGFREALEFLGAPRESGGPNPRASAGASRGGGAVGASARPAGTAPAAGYAPSPRAAPATPAVSEAAVRPPSAPPDSAEPVVEPSGQTALFAPPASTPGPASESVSAAISAPSAPHAFPAPSAAASAPAAIPSPSPRGAPAPDDRLLREAVLAALLRLAVPVQGPVARYLQKRRIFKRTWDGQGLRMIDDYAATGAALEREFGRSDLEHAGFFNPAGNLRYYRHRLLFPYFDAAGKPVYLQARGIEDGVKPKELSMAGPIPLPYNVRLLDGSPGQIYLCEGVIDTLTLLEQGFPAVGAPGAANFKPAWAPLFRNKSVHVAFDPDAPGENGAARAIGILEAAGVEARRLQPPKGLDLNDWFRKG
jgi:hypothetical protein